MMITKMLSTSCKILLIVALFGCAPAALPATPTLTATLTPTATFTPAPTTTATPTPFACQPSQILTSKSGFHEIQGAMEGGELWALLFFDSAHARQDLKIVWRVSGTGVRFTLRASQADGRQILPIWGPELHESSNWNRPGDEYGAGFNFPSPGCWTISAMLGKASGHISLQVLP